MHGVFLDTGTVDNDDIDFQAIRASLPTWDFHAATAPREITARIETANVVITNKVILDREVLSAASRLKLVCIAATGANNVDTASAAANGITVCNVRNYATTSVVEHVFSLIFSLARRLTEYQALVKAGHWQQSGRFCLLDYSLDELAGKTLGIIGYGELGKAVAATARCLGMQVLVAARDESDTREDRVPLTTLLAESHIISLHCPLTPETRDLISTREFEQMRHDAFLVNTARGGIVNEPALLHALENGEIAAAALDVLAEEPPKPDNPLIGSALPNLVITPHIAWASRSARQTLVDEVAKNITAFMNGQPRNTIGDPAYE